MYLTHSKVEFERKLCFSVQYDLYKFTLNGKSFSSSVILLKQYFQKCIN